MRAVDQHPVAARGSGEGVGDRDLAVRAAMDEVLARERLECAIGIDLEPGAEERRDFALSCRIYRSEGGGAEQPQESWIRDALIEAAK